ncbi:hypothetical protein [Rahnella contaminans]|uniref:hypothetical protein n=1 Tax=Rahnella contaminans TaxID=2703882 RepID=UPI0023DCCF38|nr:hypothetical protein [Rahnella contaminans]MDF1895853.1 hypothetical protein [Rahnella contaminans]
MVKNQRYLYILFILLALTATVALYLNDNRTRPVPDGDISYSNTDFSMHVYTCIISKSNLFVSGWAAIKNNTTLKRIYITSPDNKNGYHTQSSRGYDVAKAIGVPEKSVARFSSSQVLSNDIHDKRFEIQIIAESESGSLFGGKYVCNN